MHPCRGGWGACQGTSHRLWRRPRPRQTDQPPAVTPRTIPCSAPPPPALANQQQRLRSCSDTGDNRRQTAHFPRSTRTAGGVPPLRERPGGARPRRCRLPQFTGGAKMKGRFPFSKTKTCAVNFVALRIVVARVAVRRPPRLNPPDLHQNTPAPTVWGSAEHSESDAATGSGSPRPRLPERIRDATAAAADAGAPAPHAGGRNTGSARDATRSLRGLFAGVIRSCRLAVDGGGPRPAVSSNTSSPIPEVDHWSPQKPDSAACSAACRDHGAWAAP